MWATPATPKMERQMFTKSFHVGVTEPSYFNFVMTKSSFRRTCVPFAKATGILPERTRDYRATPPSWLRSN